MEDLLLRETEISKKFKNSVYMLDNSRLKDFLEDQRDVRLVRDGLIKDLFLVKKSPLETKVSYYYFNGSNDFRGESFHSDLEDKDHFLLLLYYCECLTDEYKLKSTIDCFNVFQNCYRFLLHEEGVLTCSSYEVEKYKLDKGIFVSHYDRIECIHFIDSNDFYKDMFRNVGDDKVLEGEEYNYLFVNLETNLFKIGYSKNPLYREKTLQSEEPKIKGITFWKGNLEEEKVLHNLFKEKRVRGEWFKLSLSDLRSLREKIR